MLRLPSGVKDGSYGGEGEGDEVEDEGGDDADCRVQGILRCVIVDVLRLQHDHDSGERICNHRLHWKGKVPQHCDNDKDNIRS